MNKLADVKVLERITVLVSHFYTLFMREKYLETSLVIT